MDNQQTIQQRTNGQQKDQLTDNPRTNNGPQINQPADNPTNNQWTTKG